jgi:hypothetical protein
MLRCLLFIANTLGIRMTKINDLSWSSVYLYEITKFSNVRYRHFCCWFNNEIWQNRNRLCLKNHVYGKDPGAPKFPPFLSRPFNRVFQRLRHKSLDPVEFRSGIQNMLEIKLSFETCNRWETEQRILAVYSYSIKRTSPLDLNKNKDTRKRKILLRLHLYKQVYGREFSGFHSCVF